MANPRRITILAAIPLLLGLASAFDSGRAQTEGSSRFAFADTTLLRDTLDLHFDGLFELADSLEMLPDTLRALSIRYEFPLARLVFLADSMRVPVDSVGPVLERERFNPLSAVAERTTSLRYGSRYDIGRQNRSWTNTSDYNLVRGGFFTRNVTSVSQTRTRQVGGTAEYVARTSNTEVGWRLSPNLSVGGRVNLRRTDNVNPSAINRSTQNDEYQFSLRTRQAPTPGLTSSFDFFGGPYHEPNSIPARRGWGAQVTGSVAYLVGDWLTNDIAISLMQRWGEGRQPERDWLDAEEHSRSLVGTTNLFPARPIGLRIGYRLSGNLNERPTIDDRISREESRGNSVDLDLRIRGRQDRRLTLSGSISNARSFIELQRKERFVYEPRTTIDRSFGADGRYTLRGWVLDARVTLGRPNTEGPAQGQVVRETASDTTVDYRERDRTWTRSVTTTLSRNLTQRLIVKLTGAVSLNSYRYGVVDTSYRAEVGDGFVIPTPPREDYRQSYRLETSYAFRSGSSTALELEVSRALNLFLTGDRSAQSTEDRVYRAVWRWTHRLMRGLSVTQRNQMTATYRNLPYADVVDALTLSYTTLTTLNAVVTPRLSIDVTHNRKISPRGDYLGRVDGQPTFRLSEETNEYQLSGNVSYRPIPALTFSVSPFYRSSLSEGTVSGQAVPRNETQALNLGGGVTMNVPIGDRAQLTGNIKREFSSSRTTRYRSGVPEPSPRADYDYWSGSLNLSWRL